MSISGKKKFIFLRITISIGFISLLLYLMRDRLPQVLSTLRQVNLLFFIMGLALYILNIIMAASRLKLVFNIQKIFIPLKDLIYLAFIGFFFNNFFPTSIGGDLVKAYYISKRSNNKLISIASIFIDRVFGLLTLMVIALFVLFFIKKTPQYTQLMWILSIIIFAEFLTITFLSSSKLMSLLSRVVSRFKWYSIKDGVDNIHNCFVMYFKNRPILASILSISLIGQVLGMASICVLAKGLGLNVSIFVLFLTIPIIFASSMIPSINGLGVREGAFVFCLKDIIGAENAFALSILFLAMMLSASSIGGILFLLNKGYGSKLDMQEKGGSNVR